MDSGVLELAHNTKVEGAATALDLLQRLQREFAPLLRERGWTVKLLQEMCCCSAGGGIKRGRGVLGMNHGSGNKRSAHKIEIRLRHAADHKSFKDFEGEIVGIMCHELSHIAHGNHSAEFYKLMEELRAQFDKTRGSAGTDGRGTFAGLAATLHPGPTRTHAPTNARSLARSLARARTRTRAHACARVRV